MSTEAQREVWAAKKRAWRVSGGEDAKTKERASQLKWREKNRERLRVAQSERYAATKEHHIATVRRWQKKNPRKMRMYHRRKDGCPEPTRPEPNFCELCGKPPSEKLALHLDHCHESGGFRGWLCINCNTSLGKLGDNEQGLLKALSYIRSGLS